MAQRRNSNTAQTQLAHVARMRKKKNLSSLNRKRDGGQYYQEVSSRVSPTNASKMTVKQEYSKQLKQHNRKVDRFVIGRFSKNREEEKAEALMQKEDRKVELDNLQQEINQNTTGLAVVVQHQRSMTNILI